MRADAAAGQPRGAREQRQVRPVGPELTPGRRAGGDEEAQRLLAGRRDEPAEMHAGLETRDDGGEGAPSHRMKGHVACTGKAERKGAGGVGARLEADERAAVEPVRLEAPVRRASGWPGPEQELRPQPGEATPGGPGARAGLEVDGGGRPPAELRLPRGDDRVAAPARPDA